MSHEIEKNSITGLHEFAYSGAPVWHNLGQELQRGASIEDWVTAAQMDWSVLGSPVQFNTEDGMKSYTGQQVLFRSDSKQPLSIVSDQFRVVQPKEVLEFFRDLTQRHGMELEAAGCLFNGKRFWATASSGRAADILPNDEVKAYLVLMTGVDGTLATSAKFVATRVVCNNTLRLAVSETGGREARRTHRQWFDASDIKLDLGLFDNTWTNYVQNMKNLAGMKMSDDQSFQFFKSLLVTPQEKKLKDGMKRSTKQAIDDLMERLRNGIGAESGRGTGWNALNAVTEKYTHGTVRRDANRQFINSMYGTDAAIKDRAANLLIELAEMVN